MNKVFALAILLFYIVSKYVFYDFWNQYDVGYSYLFELIYCISVSFVFKEDFKSSIKRLNLKHKLSLLSFGLGALSVLLTKHFFILPFDLQDSRTIFSLLIIAPILEEWIFRSSIWSLLKQLVPKPAVFAISVATFSASHLIAILYVPKEFFDFVIFQSFYTLVLAYLCSRAIAQKQGLTQAVYIHFLFNFGFYLFGII